MTKLGAILAPGLRFVRERQLPSGEMLCHAPVGGNLCYCPYPFWSAIAYDALAFADPASTRFDRRILNLLPAAERREVPAMVSATRWRIRTYLASQEEADCTWRLHGRRSASRKDAATSSCAAEALLTPPPLDFRPAPSRHSGLLRRWLKNGSVDATGRCYILSYLSAAGEAAGDIPAEVLRMCRSDAEKSPSFWFAAARALNRAGSMEPDGVSCAAVFAECATEGNRTHGAMALAALLDLGHDGPEIRELITGVLSSAVNPAGWMWPTYALNGAGSAGATMSLMLSALFRASSTAGGEML